MKRISSLIACGVLALGFATSSNAQTITSQLIIKNANGTGKLSLNNPTTTGFCFDQRLTLCRPGSTSDMVTFNVPSGINHVNFDFPSTGGTLLTTGNAAEIINTINSSNLTIDADNITGLTTGITGLQSDASILIGGSLTIPTISVNPTWLSGQLSGYATTASLAGYATTGSLANYALASDLTALTATVTGHTSDIAQLNTDLNALEATVSGLGGGGTTVGGTYTHTQLTNASETLSSSVVGNIWVNISSNGPNANSRKFTLPNGDANGRMMVIYSTSGPAQLENGTNVQVAGTMNFATGSSITLIWNGSKWFEISRKV